MRYPFDEVRGEYRSAFLVSLVAAVSAMAGLLILDWPTRNDLTPLGQISFQFAGNTQSAVGIIDQWAADGVLHYAGASIGFDYLWMIMYGILLMLLAGWAGSRVDGGWRNVAGIASWAVFVAVGLDMVEGAMLLTTISDPMAANPEATLVVASIKFGLLAASVLASIIVFAVGGSEGGEGESVRDDGSSGGSSGTKAE